MITEFWQPHLSEFEGSGSVGFSAYIFSNQNCFVKTARPPLNLQSCSRFLPSSPVLKQPPRTASPEIAGQDNGSLGHRRGTLNFHKPPRPQTLSPCMQWLQCVFFYKGFWELLRSNPLPLGYPNFSSLRP